MHILTRGVLSVVSFTAVASLRPFGMSMMSTAAALHPKVSLGAGCYWGTEKYIVKDFATDVVAGAIKGGAVGFMNPRADAVANPSYREVCGGRTGYVEVYDAELSDPSEDTFRKLLKHFFSFHDPTTMDRQGNDRGSQYASAIFCYDDRQVEIAEEVKAEIQSLIDSRSITSYAGNTVTTAIHKATKFYPAEAEHQEYLMKNPGGYCNHAYRFQWNWDKQ